MQAAEMGGCKEIRMCKLPSLVSGEGVDSLSFALLMRGAWRYYSPVHCCWCLQLANLQKCCTLPGQRFQNQLIKRSD